MEQIFSAIFQRTKHLVEMAVEHRRTLAKAGAGLALCAALFGAYRWHLLRCQEQALTALEEQVMPAVHARVGKVTRSDIRTFPTIKEKTNAAIQACQETYKQYKRTTLAGVFKAYEAQACIQQGEYDHAHDLMNQASAAMPQRELAELYQLSAISLKLDSKDYDTAQKGVVELTQIAQSPAHAAHEMALYILGAHYWANRDFMQAKQYWQELVVRYGAKDTHSNSGIADRVRGQLALISSDF